MAVKAPTPTIPTNGAGAAESASSGAIPFDGLLALLRERLQTGALAETVYGPSRTVGDRTIIPVARVAYGFGLGGGASPTSAGAGAGSGGGGGAGVKATPVAVVEISPGGTRIIPIVDVGQIVTRAFVFAGCMALAGMLLGRRPASAGAGMAGARRRGWFRFARR
jgi:uncharacterized spore protein YtfJ